MAIIGRESWADITMPMAQVSSRHALVEPAGAGRYRFVDLGSSNGVYINGERVSEGLASIHDDVRLGSAPFDWNVNIAKLQAEERGPRGLTVGREPGNDVVISDQRVSARHARVVPQGSSLLIRDLGSSNGILVNGRPVATAVVSKGDSVFFGSMPIDLFGLLAARGAIGAIPPAAAPPRPQEPQPVSQHPLPHVPVAPADRKPRNSANSRTWLVAAAVVVAVLVGGGLAFVFATRQEVIKKCENCGTELFRREAYFYNASDVRREADQQRWCSKCANEMIPVKKCEKCGEDIMGRRADVMGNTAAGEAAKQQKWCAKCGDEPVTYYRRELCQFCKRVIREVAMSAPRKTEPKDVEVQAGYCSSACRLQATAEETGKGVKDTVDNLLNKLTR